MTEIHALLERIERERGVEILYACESGSRAWGFASPDSDYDIRFIFLRPENSYLSVLDGLETIELPLEGDLDAGGWDVRKAVKLLGKSNGALVEWLHSPIVYREVPGFRTRWQGVAREVFDARSSSDHYRGLARQMVLGKLGKDQVRAKDYLYALRSILCAKWVSAGRGIPPVLFQEVLEVAPAEISALVPALLEYKARTGEGEKMSRIPELDSWLKTVLEEPPTLISRGIDSERLDTLLRVEVRVPAVIISKEDLSLDRVRQPDMLLLDCISGSRAFGTAIEGSDTDRRGVFVAPRAYLSGLDDIELVSDERNNEVMHEVGHFVGLLSKNNPNAMELLAMPEDCILKKHPLFDLLRPELFLSKLCAVTFGDYSMGQIRKARGLNKKIVNPQPEKRMGLLEFCHVPEGQGSVPVLEWLANRSIDARKCGLTAVKHAAGVYAIYHGSGVDCRGLVSPKDPDALIFSSVPLDAAPVGWMHFNADAFRSHCKAHREYWQWVEDRNEERYLNNSAHGRGYDSKNLLHTFRLLDMAEEIVTEGVIRVRRPNRDFLLRIRAGEFDYEYLVQSAEERLRKIQAAFEKSSLPERPDRQKINRLLVEIRAAF